MNDAERIQEWLYRVGDEVSKLNADYADQKVTLAELYDKITQSYETLSVMKMVATGQAYMRGITPLKEL
jgi:hypothetical protein